MAMVGRQLLTPKLQVVHTAEDEATTQMLTATESHDHTIRRPHRREQLQFAATERIVSVRTGVALVRITVE